MSGETPKSCPGLAIPASRLDQANTRLERAKQALSQARARRREEQARQERISRLRERQRLENEQRLLGDLCRQAGLANLEKCRRPTASGESVSAALDKQLILGGLMLLAEQISELSDENVAQLRANGASAFKSNPEESNHE